jgi:ClpP class serine protease
MKPATRAALAAVRAQPWAILPEYLDAIEALAARALETDVLAQLAADGHADRHLANVGAVAAMGQKLDGSRTATLRNGVAAIPVFGPIFPRANLIGASSGGTALDALMADFRVAQASEAVDRILMVVDSPGGVVSGLGEAADTIRRSSKPVTAFVTGISASAAYWLASQAGELVVEPAASVGSIGVVASTTRSEGADQNGRRLYEVVSSGAPRKRPDMSSEEGRAAIQEEVDALEAVFVADVAAGRRVTTAKVLRDFGKGGMVPAARAVEVGMADRVGTLDQTLSGLARRVPSSQAPSRRALAERDLELRQRRAN